MVTQTLVVCSLLDCFEVICLVVAYTSLLETFVGDLAHEPVLR